MSEQIQKYTMLFGHMGKADTAEEVVKLSDHAAQLQQAREDATRAERERCRREEVEPLWDAIGDVVCSAHMHFRGPIDKVLKAAHDALQIRASVGEVQSSNPIAALETKQNGRQNE